MFPDLNKNQSFNAQGQCGPRVEGLCSYTCAHCIPVSVTDALTHSAFLTHPLQRSSIKVEGQVKYSDLSTHTFQSQISLYSACISRIDVVLARSP